MRLHYNSSVAVSNWFLSAFVLVEIDWTFEIVTAKKINKKIRLADALWEVLIKNGCKKRVIIKLLSYVVCGGCYSKAGGGEITLENKQNEGEDERASGEQEGKSLQCNLSSCL